MGDSEADAKRYGPLDETVVETAIFASNMVIKEKDTRIAELETVLRDIVEMIDECPDAPKATDSLPQVIRFYADGALRGVDTGVK